jgi:proteic killer suppression protein
VIRSFADKRTVAIFREERTRGISDGVARAAKRKLDLLHAAIRLKDLARLPGNRLEKLKGVRAGRWSIRVNERWRICFLWDGRDAHDVEFVNYH